MPVVTNADDARAAVWQLVRWIAAGDGAAEQGERKPSRAAKGKHVDERMLSGIRDNAEALYWSSKQWADNLGCSKSTVIDSPTWKQTCKPARERERLSRGKRLRRKTR
jgi:hypothetical protein